MQLIQNDKSVQNDTIRDFEDLKSKFLATPAKKTDQLASMTPGNKKSF